MKTKEDREKWAGDPWTILPVVKVRPGAILTPCQSLKVVRLTPFRKRPFSPPGENGRRW
jgi:hypothetical protein